MSKKNTKTAETKAPKAKTTKTKTPATEKVKGTPGRKPTPIVIPRKAFTIAELFTANSKDLGNGLVKCELTIRNYVKKAVEAGTLVADGKVVTGTVGAPAQKFIPADVKAKNEARKANRKKSPTAVAVAEASAVGGEAVTETAELVAA